jgi:hypothetical protein
MSKPIADPPAGWEDIPYRQLVQSIRDYAIFMLDPEGHVTTWNEGAQRIKGYRADEIIGRHFSTFYPPAALAKAWPQHELETARRLGRFEDEGWRVRKDGTMFWANVIITAIRDEHGRLLGFSKVTGDQTERRAHEERLRQSEERFRLLVENVQDYAIFLIDPRGYVMTWNAGAQRIKGYDAAEIIGRHFSTFYPPDALERNWPAQELQEAARLGHFEDEGWRLRKDGSRFWANVVITPMRDRDGVIRGYSKITRDLTERRAHEEELRRTEERFRLLLEGVQDYAIVLLDVEGRVSSWNTGAQRITGYDASEIVGQHFERFFPEEDIAAGRARDHLRAATLNRRSEQQGWRVRKDGVRFWAESVITALFDHDGVLRGYAKVVRDLSEKKRMESLEEQGRHLTEFLAMLAHELRNPLAPIRNALAIMSVSKESSPQIAWSREVIERQTVQLSRIVDDLLDVSRVTRGKLRLKTETMDVGASVARAVEGAKPLIEARRHRLTTDIPDQPLLVHGDLTRLTQVVVNILNNAAKYTPEGGDIHLRVSGDAHDVEICVRDSGVGIPEHLLPRVFDLFAQGERTLDRSEGGLGIGLTLARRIVTLHGGTIVAKSAGPGRGSEFVVTLPRLRLERYVSPPPARELELPQEGERCRVLVVDDNVDAADSLATLLRMAGHEVDVAHDGSGAIASAARATPDVILLDIGLPGMSGYEVAERLRAVPGREGMRIYALTGYGNEDDQRRSYEAGFDGHLVKPVMPEELIALMGSGAGSG